MRRIASIEKDKSPFITRRSSLKKFLNVRSKGGFNRFDFSWKEKGKTAEKALYSQNVRKKTNYLSIFLMLMDHQKVVGSIATIIKYRLLTYITLKMQRYWNSQGKWTKVLE